MTDDTRKPEPTPNDVKILPPDFSLKEKIGMHINLKDIFTPERVAQAQQAIDDTQAEFVEWAQKDLVELEHSYRHIAENPEAAPAARTERIRKVAFSLKCQCGTFGYPLGSEVARSLYKYTSTHGKFTSENLVVLRKHIDALQVILQQNIQGEGGTMGAELMTSLERLVAKFS